MLSGMDEVLAANERAWDRKVREGQSTYTRPVSTQEVEAARHGDVRLHLGTRRLVPPQWLPELRGCRVLCLAAGGGQQAPLLAAAGARVTVLDLSAEQLSQDRMVARRDSLELEAVQGDMRDLTGFPDGTFDLIVHPVANCFIPDVRPLWGECYRVLCPGGSLLSAFVNPILYALAEDGLCLEHRIPYSDLEQLSAEQREKRMREGGALEFGHSLQDLLGGQVEAGFHLTGFFEADFPGKPVDAFLPTLLATRATRPA
jgi:SAM-dependent methyltransferase